MQALGGPTILEAMEERKTCLFCGKHVECAFQFCPHCGYEFWQGEDIPVLAEETVIECPKGGETDYLLRLRTLQELLADMERELDLIIRTSSKGP